jgi:hypothetical protein
LANRGRRTSVYRSVPDFRSNTRSLLTSSLAFLKAASMSSSGFHTRGRPPSSYRNRSSNVVRKVLTTVASEVCSSNFLRIEIQSLARSVAIFRSFSSLVQLYAGISSALVCSTHSSLSSDKSLRLAREHLGRCRGSGPTCPK